MKKLVVAFLFGLALIAHAKPPAKPPATIKPIETEKKIKCFPLKKIVLELRDRYGEEPMIMGVTETLEDVGMGLFMNRETGTYTIIEFDEETACVISVGKNVHYRLPKNGLL